MANSILITGATGLIGRRLTKLLLQKGCRVSHLGRSILKGDIPSFTWNLAQGSIDPAAFAGIDCIIHLAGAGIAERRWTASRKKEILESRTRSAKVLYDYLKNNSHTVRTVVSASAIGYYGFDTGEQVFDESSSPGADFLSGVVRSWEQEVDSLASLGLRVVKIRTGIVLSKDGGALKEMARPVRWGFGASLGSGQQVVSWIHLDDLCNMFIMACEDERMKGAYNATAPSATTNQELTESIARVLHRKIVLPNVPPFVLHMLVGEMAELVLHGSHVSSRKIQEAGFTFRYPELVDALTDALRRE